MTQHSFVTTFTICICLQTSVPCPPPHMSRGSTFHQSMTNIWSGWPQPHPVCGLVSAHGHPRIDDVQSWLLCVLYVLHGLDWTTNGHLRLRHVLWVYEDNSGPSSFSHCALSVNLDLSGLLFRFSVTRMLDFLWCRLGQDGHYEGQTNAVFLIPHHVRQRHVPTDIMGN